MGLTYIETGGGLRSTPWPYIVDNSALFDGVDDYLGRIAAPVDSNRDQFTVFASVKLAGNNNLQPIACAGYGSVDNTNVEIRDDGRIRFIHWASSSYYYEWNSTANLNDQTGHYHVLVAVDTSFADPNDRIRVQVNGADVAGAWTIALPLNEGTLHFGRGSTGGQTQYYTVGRRATQDYYLPGYLSNVHYIDGQFLDSSDFGEFSDTVPGLWTYTGYTGTYGVHGFYLDFADGADLGKDVSGNGNHMTTYGAPSQSIDTPTNNHCVLAANDHRTTGTLSGGNLTTGGPASITLRPPRGKWSYKRAGVEQTYDADTSGRLDPTVDAESYDFGAGGYTPSTGYKTVCAANLPSGGTITAGTYTGNGTAQFVYTHCALASVTIEGTTYDNDGTDSAVVHFFTNGFKLVSATQNASATDYDWTGVLKYPAKYSNAQTN